jgi:16S rRNA (cytosine1402-N4)-methyltransferase
MPREVLHFLQSSPGLTVLDGTVGAAGHSSLILKAIGPSGQLIGVDRDPMMLNFAAAKLSGDNFRLSRGSYLEATEIFHTHGLEVDRCCWIWGFLPTSLPTAIEDLALMIREGLWDMPV